MKPSDHRAALLELLAHYKPIDNADAQQAEGTREFVLAHQNCFSRQLDIGHITGSAWLVDKSGTKVLLTHHRKLNIWVQLGGHADDNPNILEVALREAKEESGLDNLKVISPEIFDVDVHRIPARGNEIEHFHYDIRFALSASTCQDFVVSDESHALAWIEISKIGEFTKEESMLRMARKWVQQGLRL